MKTLLLTAALLCSASAVQATTLIYNPVLVEWNKTTNPLVYDGAYDVYSVRVYNPADTPVIALELSLVGEFIQAGGTDFGSGPDNPVVFGFEAPDTFFSLPESVDAGLALGVNIVDTESELSGAYTTQGGAPLVPAMGSALIVTVSVPSGTHMRWPNYLGRADVGGRFAPIYRGPEPSTAVLAGLALVSLATRRR